MRKYLPCLCSILLFVSCNNSKVPGDILPPEKMQDVLWDIIRADVFTNEFVIKDSTKSLPAENVKLQKLVFAKYQVTKNDFYKSYSYYEAHPLQMKEMMDSMIARKRRLDVIKIAPVIKKDSFINKKLDSLR